MKCILKGIKVDESRLQEYWAKAKVLLIATSAFELPANYDSALQGNIEGYALHGIQFLHSPCSIQRIAARLHPSWASIPDREGNYPLHNAICEAPCQSNLPPLVKEILSAFPEAAMRKNLEGEAPLFDAMRKGMIWEKGRKDIVLAQSLCSTDHQTGLCPFLLAASLNEESSMEISYQLLSANASLIKHRYVPVFDVMRVSGRLVTPRSRITTRQMKRATKHMPLAFRHILKTLDNRIKWRRF